MTARPAFLHVIIDPTPGPHPIDQLETIFWWTPFLGPTASIAAAHLAIHATTKPRTPMCLDELRQMLGLDQLRDRVWRTLDRLEQFGAIQFQGADTITARSHLRALDEGLLERLPPHIAAVYRLTVPEAGNDGREGLREVRRSFPV